MMFHFEKILEDFCQIKERNILYFPVMLFYDNISFFPFCLKWLSLCHSQVFCYCNFLDILIILQGSDQSPSQLRRGKNRRNGIISKQDGITNGASHSGKLDHQCKMIPEHSTSRVKDTVISLLPVIDNIYSNLCRKKLLN